MSQEIAIKPYHLLDSGKGRKLEDMGGWIIERQSPVAFWTPRLNPSEWKKAVAVHVRKETGGGFWSFPSKKITLPSYWHVRYGDFKVKVKPTAFGHVGFFAEQLNEWNWLKKNTTGLRVLNLFGYTGMSSVASSLGGADVTHVDAAKGVVDWGRELAELNAAPKDSIRWIVDDAIKFIEREIRRGSLYDAIIMDPPSFGRGPKGELFKIEEDILMLLAQVRKLFSKNAKFLHFSCHTPGFTPTVIENLIRESFETEEWKFSAHEMLIEENPKGLKKRYLPSGICALVEKY